MQKNEKYADQRHDKCFLESESNYFPLEVFCCHTSTAKLGVFTIPAENIHY